MYAIEAVGLRKGFKNKEQRRLGSVDPGRGRCRSARRRRRRRRPPRAERRRQDDDADDAARSHRARRGHRDAPRPPLPEGRTAALEQTNFTASYIGLPYKVRVREILDIFRTLYGARRERVDELVEAFGLRLVPRPLQLAAVVGAADARRPDEVAAVRAAAAGAGRADRVPRPGGLGARPAGDPGRAREGRLHAARDVPQHGGHRAPVPARGVHREGTGRRGRLADRDRTRSTARRTWRRRSCTSPEESST